MKMILQWGWKIALFSSAFQERNMVIANRIAAILKIKVEDIKVCSRTDLSEEKESSLTREYRAYDLFSHSRKKNLEKAGFDLSDCVLIDDNPLHFVVPEQWPQIIANLESSNVYMKDFLLGKTVKNLKKKVGLFLNLPFVILGFLEKCRLFMDEHKDKCLRDALKTYLPKMTPEEFDYHMDFELEKECLAMGQNMLTPTVIFDLDDCWSKVWNESSVRSHEEMQIMFPECEILEIWKDEGKTTKQWHLVPKAWVRAMKIILEWQWKLAIFSTADKYRNVVLAGYMAEKLDIKGSDIKICSQEDLLLQPGYEIPTEAFYEMVFKSPFKKDLVKAGFNLNNCVLIDDRCANIVVPDQWPQFIPRMMNATKHMENYLKGVTDGQESKKFAPFLNLPYVVLGFLAKCRKFLKENPSQCLRNALQAYLPELSPTADDFEPSSELCTECLKVGQKLLSVKV